ncbi:hypothetical protein OSB04_031709 [Centaurea solstitialis]|uniref:Integrase catalytic domain-containing protein n=1 Tax=Centaurea solstitialis TaxID=347529 RepID=A0AA38SM70_9ASTR|nr:hypothetical protein OSB04_031709 [Centaurea solstitialis]
MVPHHNNVVGVSTRKVSFSNNVNIVHRIDTITQVVDSEDDDDFAIPPVQKKIPDGCKKKRKNRKEKHVADCQQNVEANETVVDGIQTRTSPKGLYDPVKKLTPSQKVAVEEMGLGNMLNMSLDGIPGILVYFVVDNFNPDMMQLEVEGKIIRPTEELVHRTLGLPKTGIDLNATVPNSCNKNFYKAWRSWFPKTRKIMPNVRVVDLDEDLVDAIEEDMEYDADPDVESGCVPPPINKENGFDVENGQPSSICNNSMSNEGDDIGNAKRLSKATRLFPDDEDFGHNNESLTELFCNGAQADEPTLSQEDNCQDRATNQETSRAEDENGGDYLSHEFYDYLRNYGIVSQLSSPRTPQLNGVAERRNRTLLDMVQPMMSRATLPMSSWGYALETTIYILNLVPTKKVAKTPSEMWTGARPSLAHIKV